MTDSIKPTERNRLMAMFADAIKAGSGFVGAPGGFANPPGQMLMEASGINSLGRILDNYSYDGQTLKSTLLTPRGTVNDDAVGAAGLIAGGAPAAFRIGPQVARGAARFGEAALEGATVGPRALQRGRITTAAPEAAPAAPVLDLSDPSRAPTRAQADLLRYDPARGVSSRVERLLANKAAKDKLGEWMSRGMDDEGIYWYNMEPLKEQFIKRLGNEEGTSSFDQYMELIGATSAGAKTDANARIASYYYVNADGAAKVPIPPLGSGYGHKMQPLHNKNANEILQGGGLDTIEHPKRTGFTENLKGNLQPIAVDKHNVRAIGMASRDPEWLSTRLVDETGAPTWWDEAAYGQWAPEGFNPRSFAQQHNPKWENLPPTWFDDAPKANEYAALERYNQDLAESMGLEPARGQSALWLGAGDVTGLGSPPVSMARTFEELLQKRAKIRGESPETVLDKFIRRVQPLAVGGMGTALGAGALYGGDDGYR